jgi:hypothetical protein
MTEEEQAFEDKIVEQKIVQGPWKAIPETHIEKHKRWFNNIVELLADLDNGVFEIPRDALGKVQWSEMSIEFLIQWTLLNSTTITHKHGELK